MRTPYDALFLIVLVAGALHASDSRGSRLEVYTAQGQRHGFFNEPPWLEKTIKRIDAFLAEPGCLEGPPIIDIPEGGNRSGAPEKR